MKCVYLRSQFLRVTREDDSRNVLTLLMSVRGLDRIEVICVKASAVEDTILVLKIQFGLRSSVLFHRRGQLIKTSIAYVMSCTERLYSITW